MHPAAAKPKKDEEKRKETVEKEKKKENVKVQVHSVPNDAQMAAQKLNEPPKYPPPPPPSDVNDEIKTVNIELVNFFFFQKIITLYFVFYLLNFTPISNINVFSFQIDRSKRDRYRTPPFLLLTRNLPTW